MMEPDRTRIQPTDSAGEILLETSRGALVEARHWGHIVVVNPEGSVVANAGNPEKWTYLRSCAKPHQCIPLVTSGAAERFRFSDQELAIACGSHDGEPIHTHTVLKMLEKVGLGVDSLKCGTHEPYSKVVAEAQRRDNRGASVLQNNCSGKHAGMLAVSVHWGNSIDSYDQADHPVQRSIRRTICEFVEAEDDELALGIDGCGVPTYGMSLFNIALLYARFIAPPAWLDPQTKAACKRIGAAMTEYPEMVCGSIDCFDTELMRSAAGVLIPKSGAAGVYTIGVFPCRRWTQGLGIVIKMEDGKGDRPLYLVVVQVLRELSLLSNEALTALESSVGRAVTNHRGEVVGEMSARFQLGL